MLKTKVWFSLQKSWTQNGLLSPLSSNPLLQQIFIYFIVLFIYLLWPSYPTSELQASFMMWGSASWIRGSDLAKPPADIFCEIFNLKYNLPLKFNRKNRTAKICGIKFYRYYLFLLVQHLKARPLERWSTRRVVNHFIVTTYFQQQVLALHKLNYFTTLI